MQHRHRSPAFASSRAVRTALAAAAALMWAGATRCAAEDAAHEASTVAAPVDWKKERQFWSFQRPVAPPRPIVRDAAWCRTSVDGFVLARLEEHGLRPSPEADPRSLIRRAAFDITGLPPTPEEVDDFLADPRDDAYPKLVDRLLASSRFGEHFASLWLPLARFAEDQAHQVGDDTTYFYGNAWRYRDWVIRAFNRDLPYDRFLSFQLAADRLSAADDDDLPALGFLGLGPKYYDRGRLAVQADEWEDRVDTVCRAMLGLTVACARCHDHKFDPIPTRDYYELAGVFASSRMANRGPDGREEKDNVPRARMQTDTRHIVTEGTPRDLNVFIRGNVDRKGPLEERHFLTVLSEGEPARFTSGSGRQELAAAIVSRDNPLTARVMVNRIWTQLIGRPLVPTPSNFGRSGMAPTQPRLLDHLAVRFMDEGWSVKSLMREILLSAAYRQSSTGGKADPENALLSRMPRRRLSIEQWRDTLLFLTGELDPSGGRSADLSDPANRRRTVFARVSRLKLDDLLMQFDYPDANVHAEKRSATTTAIQKLFVLNSPFMSERAKKLAQRVAAEAGGSETTRVRLVHRLLFNREPDAEELRLATDFLARPAAGELPRWEQYAQLMLASNELLYVD